jgi:hypothetical protein
MAESSKSWRRQSPRKQHRMPTGRDLYQTRGLFRRTLRVAYPPGSGELVVRTELDWNTDVKPTSVTEEGI